MTVGPDGPAPCTREGVGAAHDSRSALCAPFAAPATHFAFSTETAGGARSETDRRAVTPWTSAIPPPRPEADRATATTRAAKAAEPRTRRRNGVWRGRPIEGVSGAGSPDPAFLKRLFLGGCPPRRRDSRAWVGVRTQGGQKHGVQRFTRDAFRAEWLEAARRRPGCSVLTGANPGAGAGTLESYILSPAGRAVLAGHGFGAPAEVPEPAGVAAPVVALAGLATARRRPSSAVGLRHGRLLLGDDSRRHSGTPRPSGRRPPRRNSRRHPKLAEKPCSDENSTSDNDRTAPRHMGRRCTAME